MDNSHIGREHAHALTAIHDRARRVLAERRFAEPPGTADPVVAANAPDAAPVRVRQRPSGPVNPVPAQMAPAPPTAPDPDEDLEFLDGRWTSRGW